jgi:YHS domain-containing protein
MAEIVKLRRAHPAAPAPAPAAKEAVDPICGMTVVVGTARYSAQVKDKTYYFCCGGCRSKFLQREEAG